MKNALIQCCPNVVWQHCVCHNMNLAVRKMCFDGDIPPVVLSKCQKIVAHFKRLPQATLILKGLQQEIQEEEKTSDEVTTTAEIIDLEEGDEPPTPSEASVTTEATNNPPVARILAVVNDQETRWGSTFSMVERIIQL